jgi:spore coat protein U-like protein
MSIIDRAILEPGLPAAAPRRAAGRVPARRRHRSTSLALRLALLLMLPVAPWAHAQVAEDCTVSSTPVAFGPYDALSATPLDGSGQVTVDCRRTNTVAFVTTLSRGDAGSYAPRAMSSGGNLLQYNLYTNAARTIVFGDGTGGTSSVLCFTGVTTNGCIGSNPSGQGRRAFLPFYGRIPAGQDVASGNYVDTVQVTIVF